MASRLLLRFVAAVFLALLCRVDLAAAGEVVIDDTFTEASLGRLMDLAYDPAGDATLDDVLAGKLQFAPSTKDVPSFGYRKGAEWARVVVRNRRGVGTLLYAVHGYGQTDALDLFVRCAGQGSVAPMRRGDHRPDELQVPPFRLATFAIHMPPDACELTFRLASDAAHQLPLRLYDEQAFDRMRVGDTVVEAAYFGALLAMALYNVLVFVAVRAPLYLSYVAFLLAYAMFQLGLSGIGFAFLWRDSGAFVDAVSPMFIGLVGISSTVFAVQLFDGHEMPRALVRLRHALLVLLTLHQGAVWIVPYSVSARAVVMLAVVWCVVLIWSGLVAARAGSRTGVIFLSAWLVFIAGTVIAALRTLGLIPTTTFTANAQQVGSVVEFLLLSFALADRIKQLQAEATRNAQLAAEHALVAQAATERLLAEQERANAELKRLDKLKDEFLANTSHELRTPLNGVIGLTEAVMKAESALGDGSRQRLSLVLKSGRRLSTLVNDILDFSKLQRGEFELKSERFELRPLLEEVLATLEPAAQQKGLSVLVEVPRDLAVHADTARVKQIVTNLVGNAIKFTDRGTVRLDAARLGARVLVRVTDTGVGIPKDAQERIFVAFEQADGSTSRTHGGTGLGLTVTKQLVELHGGAVRVESEPGRGAAFTFDLPSGPGEAPSALDGDVVESAPEAVAPLGLAALHDAGPDHRASSPPSMPAPVGTPHVETREAPVDPRPSQRGATERVLVADDDPVNIEVLRAILEPEGYHVVVANDGREAVARLHDSGPFDAVLLDVMMPKMTGLEAASTMRRAYPHGTLPILLVTAKNRPEDVVAGLRAGADDYLAKPVHGAELLARVAAHVAGVRAMRVADRLVAPELVNLVERGHVSELARGAFASRSLGLLHVAIEGLGGLAARLDEATLYARLDEAFAAIAQPLVDHGAVLELVGVDSVRFVLPRFDEAFVGAIERVLARVAAGLPTGLGLGASLHAGHVSIGAFGDASWLAVRAVGEPVLLSGELARWGARRGFRLLVTDAALAKLDVRPLSRRVGTVRLGEAGHASTAFELVDRDHERTSLDACVDALEAGRIDELQATLAELGRGDPLVALLSEQVRRGQREVVLGGP